MQEYFKENIRELKKMKFIRPLLFSLASTFIAQTALAQQSTIPPGIYSSGPRYIIIEQQGDRTCYQGISTPPGRHSIAVGETTGSVGKRQGRFIAEGWSNYSRDAFLNLEGTTISVANEDEVLGEYEFDTSGQLNVSRSEAMSRCLNASDMFFETSPGYTMSLPYMASYRATASNASAQDLYTPGDGTLDSSDFQLPDDNSYYDTYTFSGKEGQSVTITMRSSSFDTYLFLNDSNQEIAQNDDSSEGTTDSQIVAVLPRAGEYTVIANSFDATGRGDYRLTLAVADSATAQTQGIGRSLETQSPLPSGLYFAEGTMNNNSRREILNRDGIRLCLKSVDGPPSPYEGYEEILISSLSIRNGQLFIDANDTQIEVLNAQQLQEMRTVRENTRVAFSDGTRRGVWQWNDSTAPQIAAALEQDVRMQECMNTSGDYVHRMQGALIPGRL